MSIWLFILLWVLSGIIGAGFTFAYWQGSFPTIAEEYYRSDMGISLLLGIVFGPIDLIVSFFFTGFGEHGWWFWGR